MATPEAGRQVVVQASAGTGKTYTLEQEVLRLLVSGRARLEQILVVTYTEKATGELKGRLRAAIEKELADGPAARPTLQAALDDYDQAAIFTIHAFCERALADFAFDNGHDLRLRLVDDVEVLPSCLRELQRRAWPQEYGDRLGDVLDICGYAGESWESPVLDLAGRLRTACGHLLQPECPPDWPAAVLAQDDILRSERERWRRLAGDPRLEHPDPHRWHEGFARLPFDPNRRAKRHEGLLVPLLGWLADPIADERPLASFQRLLDRCQRVSSFDKHGFHLLTEQTSQPARDVLDDYCPHLRELVDELQERRRAVCRCAFDRQLAVRTIKQLQEQLTLHKRERALQSFEDMLTRMDEALDPERNPRAADFVALLRGRYSCAVVDEFQDTDPVQWRILRRIFIDGTDRHGLTVVGDPKQAIFGFRGADLRAYMDAVAEMKTQHRAEDRELAVNWRSCPELLQSLNQLFLCSEWFKEDGIKYSPACPPEPGRQRNMVVLDNTGRSALNLIDVGSGLKAADARRAYARFVTAEIRRLLAPDALHVSVKKGPTRCLNAGDICVLVFTRREADPVVAALEAAGIGYSFYKQQGLWQSREATDLRYVLRALERPDDRGRFQTALITRFFRVPPEALLMNEDLPIAHPARELFGRWCSLAAQKQWSRLFQSLLNESGLAYREAGAPEGERALANFRYIFQTLEQAAYGGNLDLVGVIEALDYKRRNAGDLDNLQPIETEASRVQIMTVHASKGLEFPVVFLAGGFTARPGSAYSVYRDSEQRLVFDLDRDDDAAGRARAERAAEDRRLLYVALTRAMFKVYAPFVCPGTNASYNGPLVTILAPAAERAGPPAVTMPEASEPASIEPLQSQQPALERVEAPTELFPVIDPDLRWRRVVIRSFSSLHRKGLRDSGEGAQYRPRLPRLDDDQPGASATGDEMRGVAFGNLVHEVLETIDFRDVGAAAGWQELLRAACPVRSVIDAALDLHLAKMPGRLPAAQRADACRNEVARLVWNGLTTPLAALGGPLWAVPHGDRLHELEFHYPEEGRPPAPQRAGEEEFRTGFMDLLVRRDRTLHLVDWKTNVLESYTPAALNENVRACDYARQYGLYLQALARWLERVNARARPPCHVGGVYYLYLRGMNGTDESTGVFFRGRGSLDTQPDPMASDA
jgi:exodeoxyribonuclease V beta subunit